MTAARRLIARMLRGLANAIDAKPASYFHLMGP